MSRRELLDLVRAAVAGMRRAGVGAGTGVAVLTSVTPEAFAAYVAAFILGARVVGVSPGLSDRQRAHVLAADIDVAVVDGPDQVARLGPGNQLPVLSLGPGAGAVDVLAAEVDATEPLLAGGRPDDVARLVYTSGSTGLPKGCAQTYRALSARWCRQPDQWAAEDATLMAAAERYLLSGTLASAVILDYVLRCLLGGGTAVIPEDSTAPLFPHAIARYRITAAILPVPRLYAMLDELRQRPVDVSCLRALVVSGSPVSPRRYQEALTALGPVLYQDYGQTELGMISLLSPEHVAAHGDAALASVGRPHPDVEVSIRAEDETPVADGEVGEIWVRCPHMMSGYWNDPEHTAEVLSGGWLRTRDLGRTDRHGLLQLRGRTRDVIIVNAQLCHAGPIERVLATHPDVDQAYVLGVPDERTGEAIHAFVVPAGQTVPDPVALAALVRTELGEINVPSHLTVIRDVPQTANGKPDKRALLARHGGAAR
ncbi:Acyl-CoA synthetase (AMP-forming)/AMP-acid ligase II [Goodfellowiella coeruleoviolacea]|uniref:Acyl-CoA synthetase (AMP-forming)/AMP-acid ligase II n=1 Tax=Goodfellowiella coeruleoviolacea TaxID=334858 RepID=A0AAE3G9U8_9PSEU|nr:Acyl-CoA synthetase (AMP-forming)/AMP-acid ligase II [Goodfellowiella coeruleoviolacea]